MKHNVRKANLGFVPTNPRMRARSRKIRKGNLVRLEDHMLDFPVGELVGTNVGIVTSTHPKVWDFIASFTVTTVYKTKKVLDFGFYKGDLVLVRR